jgi:hypothetical protein
MRALGCKVAVPQHILMMTDVKLNSKLLGSFLEIDSFLKPPICHLWGRNGRSQMKVQFILHEVNGRTWAIVVKRTPHN